MASQTLKELMEDFFAENEEETYTFDEVYHDVSLKMTKANKKAFQQIIAKNPSLQKRISDWKSDDQTSQKSSKKESGTL
jgi:hypothetical protein